MSKNILNFFKMVKKSNLIIIIALIVLVALALIYVLKNTVSNIPQPTTPTTANGGMIELPQETTMPLDGLNIAPSTIPAE